MVVNASVMTARKTCKSRVICYLRCCCFIVVTSAGSGQSCVVDQPNHGENPARQPHAKHAAESLAELIRMGGKLRQSSSFHTINSAARSVNTSQDLVFPPDFFWGVSTSAYQVEGGISNNQWCAWETEGRVERRMGSNHTCHYTLVAKKWDGEPSPSHRPISTECRLTSSAATPRTGSGC